MAASSAPGGAAGPDWGVAMTWNPTEFARRYRSLRTTTTFLSPEMQERADAALLAFCRATGMHPADIIDRLGRPCEGRKPCIPDHLGGYLLAAMAHVEDALIAEERASWVAVPVTIGSETWETDGNAVWRPGAHKPGRKAPHEYGDGTETVAGLYAHPLRPIGTTAEGAWFARPDGTFTLVGPHYVPLVEGADLVQRGDALDIIRAVRGGVVTAYVMPCRPDIPLSPPSPGAAPGDLPVMAGALPVRGGR